MSPQLFQSSSIESRIRASAADVRGVIEQLKGTGLLIKVKLLVLVNELYETALTKLLQ